MMNKHIISFICMLCSVILNATNTCPIVYDGNKVLFRVKNPNAKAVYLSGSMLPIKKKIKTPVGTFGKHGDVLMTLNNDDWWEYSIDSVPPGLYTYKFKIDDDKEQIDSLNPNIMREGNEYISYFIIPGGYADDYETKNIPHGFIDEIWYPSALDEFKERRMMIYLPSEYAEQKFTRYPVLYLLHGSGGDEESWLDCGRLAQIMDNLIDQKRCKPMIVVMPNGIANRASAPGKDPNNLDLKSSSINIESMLGSIESVFMNDIVDFVDKNYRTLNNKQNRAIAGLSLGGLQTIFISLNNPTAFDYIGLFSAQATNALNDKNILELEEFADSWNGLSSLLPFLKKKGIFKKITEITNNISNETLSIYGDFDKKLSEQFSNPPSLYYIALGKDDFVKKLNDDFRKKLDKNKFKYIYIETEGGHTWDNWRKYLVDFLPRIFGNNN